MAENSSNTSSKALGRFVVFVLLAIFWVVFSGKFDAFHLILGAISCGLVAWFSHDLLIRNTNGTHVPQKIIRFCLYLPWLIYQVILANLHVAKLVLAPSGLDPRVVKVKSKLKSDISMVTFANSITLTPGTITMDIDNGEFSVHALSQKVADDLLSGDMENRVAYVFYENETRK